MGRLCEPREVIVTFNASGAVKAAQKGYALMIVDVIDMSTSLEAAIQGGAFMTLGASPDKTSAPVPVDPFNVGVYAGCKAKEENKEIIIITEPRWGTNEERINNCSILIEGLGGINKVSAIIPNLGGEVGRIVDFKDKLVVCVSDTGGVAYDAAWQHNRYLTTGTIARTYFSRSRQSVISSVQRILDIAKNRHIAVVAASSNAVEDVLAANYLAQKIIEGGSLDLNA